MVDCGTIDGMNAFTEAYNRVKLEEREACAKIAESFHVPLVCPVAAIPREIASAIRVRTQP